MLENGIDYKDTSDISGLLLRIRKMRTRRFDTPISDGTYKCYINAIIYDMKERGVFKDEIKKEIHRELYKMGRIIEKRSNSGYLIGNQKKSYTTWDNIVGVFNLLKSGDYKKSYERYKTFVLLSMYMYIPVRRLMDYEYMHVVSEYRWDMEKDKNYYDTTSKKFYFNIYKTRKYYNQQVVETTEEHGRILREYISENKIGDKESLFGLSKRSMINKMTNLFMKHLGKGISVNIMRHAYISYLDEHSEMISGGNADLAKLMGHSVSMQKNYVKKSENIGKEFDDMSAKPYDKSMKVNVFVDKMNELMKKDN